jgi:uncharacterized protein (DUF1697 family)
MCLKHVPKPDWIRKRREAINGPERVEAKGRELYLVYPAGIGTSKLTNSVIERALGVRGTARNWNTVMKLHRLIFSPPEPN